MVERLTGASDDPRRSSAREPATIDAPNEARPAVAMRASGANPWTIFAGAGLMGLVVLIVLMSRRDHGGRDVTLANGPSTDIAAPAPPRDLTTVEAAARAPVFAPAGSATPLPVAAPPAVQAPVAPGFVPNTTTANADLAALLQRRRAPSLVVDLDEGGGGSAGSGGPGRALTDSTTGHGPGSATGKPGPSPLTGDEQYSDRIGSTQPEHAEATSLPNPHSTVPQGTMIPAVLETAMNSDLPGFVRAVVSRDVRGFDGNTVLIPRGSRLVGQYRSGLSQGASRIFVIWTRVLRPDGASVQIASPGADPLGRTGQAGKVNTHFFREFASSILLSVIDAEVTNLAQQPTTQIVIGGTTTPGSTGFGSTVAPAAIAPVAGALSGAPAIPPTITVMQGAPISVFVARDLDFSGVRNPPP